jgi:type VI secretion system protein ImpG
MKAEKTSLSIELSCTNRDLPLRLPAGPSVLTPIQDADSCTVRLVRRPSPTRRQDSGLGRHWRLIAHLAMNQHMLAQDGLPALREMLSLYDLTRSAVSRRQIAGITALASRDTVAWRRYKHRASLVHGTELRLTVDEEAFAGSGLLLFAQVLDQFLALYVQVNSFIELVILSAQTEKELIRCKPRSGTLTLA